MSRRFTNLEKLTNGNLKITLTDLGREELDEIIERNGVDSDGAMYDLLEYDLCNGWTRLRPEQIGALTACELIITDSVEFDEDGEKIISLGRVYWHPNYMVESPVKTLIDKGEFIMDGVDSEKA